MLLERISQRKDVGNTPFPSDIGILFQAVFEFTLSIMCAELRVPGFPFVIKYLSLKVPLITNSLLLLQQLHNLCSAAARLPQKATR